MDRDGNVYTEERLRRDARRASSPRTRFPFVRLVEASGVVAQESERLVAVVRAEMEQGARGSGASAGPIPGAGGEQDHGRLEGNRGVPCGSSVWRRWYAGGSGLRGIRGGPWSGCRGSESRIAVTRFKPQGQ